MAQIDLFETLLDLLEAIEACDSYGDLEGGCAGHGPVVRAWDALALEYPDRLKAYLRSDE
jgi:hypothetical protein